MKNLLNTLNPLRAMLLIVIMIAAARSNLDKIELIKTYQLLGGGVVGDFAPVPKSQLAGVPSQGHVA